MQIMAVPAEFMITLSRAGKYVKETVPEWVVELKTKVFLRVQPMCIHVTKFVL